MDHMPTALSSMTATLRTWAFYVFDISPTVLSIG
jgi:hypothetical protein